MIPLFSGKVKTESIYCVIKTLGVMILKTRIFAVLGGDLRSVAAEKILSDFFTTRLYGFEKLGKNTDSLVKTLENADFVLLPLPLSADGKTPFSERISPKISGTENTSLSTFLPATTYRYSTPFRQPREQSPKR